MSINRGDILLVNFDPAIGKEIKKTRPALVITNNAANTFAPVIIVAAITSQKLDKTYPHEVLVDKANGLNKPSKIKLDQIKTIDKTRIIKKLGNISELQIKSVDVALKKHLGL